jgi:hypothetical protein
MKIKDDKLLHFSFSLNLMFIIHLFFELSIALFITLLIGLLKEIYDEYYGSGFDFKDILANLIGIIMGFFCLLK